MDDDWGYPYDLGNLQIQMVVSWDFMEGFWSGFVGQVACAILRQFFCGAAPRCIKQKCFSQRQFLWFPIWEFPEMGIPQNGWFIVENPIKMDDWGIPLFQETSI